MLPAWRQMGGTMTTKPVNQMAWFLVLPVIICVAFSAILPLMTVVNYSVQDIRLSGACLSVPNGLPP